MRPLLATEGMEELERRARVCPHRPAMPSQNVGTSDRTVGDYQRKEIMRLALLLPLAILGIAFGGPAATDQPKLRDLEALPVVHFDEGHYHMVVHRQQDGTLWRVIELSDHYAPIVQQVDEVPLTITVFEPQPAKH